MNRLVAGDRVPSSPEGAEMLTGVDPPLDGAVVLLEHGCARAPSALSCATAGGYAACSSVLMTRGAHGSQAFALRSQTLLESSPQEHKKHGVCKSSSWHS